MHLMDENRKPTHLEVAAYVADMAEQLAGMARAVGLASLASALEGARRNAIAVLQPAENAAPEDAA